MFYAEYFTFFSPDDLVRLYDRVSRVALLLLPDLVALPVLVSQGRDCPVVLYRDGIDSRFVGVLPSCGCASLSWDGRPSTLRLEVVPYE